VISPQDEAENLHRGPQPQHEKASKKSIEQLLSFQIHAR
jgi:hypothetical protein